MKKKIIILCCIAFLSIASIVLKSKQHETVSTEIVEQIEQINETQPPKVYYNIDIKGAITNPGVYELEDGKRVIDAIFAAGGLLENADTTRINLSKKITDEMVIIIYTKEEIQNLNEEPKIEYVYIEPTCECPDTINDACFEEKTDELTQKISLNNASLEELMTISGIGESKAKAIIEYRNEHPFKNIEELKEIKGIGDSVFEKIKDHIIL